MAHKTAKIVPSVELGDHGYLLGIAGFITSIFVGIVGLVLSAVALHQSRTVGKRNPFARAGLIIGIIRFVIDVLAIVGLSIAVFSYFGYCHSHPYASACGSSNSSLHQQYYPDDNTGNGDSSDNSDTTPTY